MLTNEKQERGQVEPSDLQLIERVKEGDMRSFEMIMNRHKAKVAAVIFGMISDTDSAEDIGQEVFIRFFKTIGNFKGDAELSTYLIRIAINLSINELNRNRKRALVPLEKMSTAETAGISDGNDSSENNELKEVLDKAIHLLDPKYKKVIVLRLVNGYSTKETAEILNLPMGTVLSRLARGQKKLQQMLEPYVKN
ncbi:MAG: sigma-70 family RNA polymerase sigma factor [Bacteroidales bacterium]|nr:sigma-70 family RNA polymerase sigma factor [Bacteroidales bacterium]MDD2322889.1 sigma-70 family RNA polymerase sigma factor [Bacteroidales bacterium]MDD3960651.1 sigma-70 family RNA polymerase sigma factor [Bacteroidales bacterium]HPE85964.1 sigma-70 family RNA polymerase sigma factor [Bacteroidales bacterium]